MGSRVVAENYTGVRRQGIGSWKETLGIMKVKLLPDQRDRTLGKAMLRHLCLIF